MEKSPEDWSKMIITRIHKKGDKLNVENYRDIALLSIPGKVFCTILMCRYSRDRKQRSLRSTCDI